MLTSPSVRYRTDIIRVPKSDNVSPRTPVDATLRMRSFTVRRFDLDMIVVELNTKGLFTTMNHMSKKFTPVTFSCVLEDCR